MTIPAQRTSLRPHSCLFWASPEQVLLPAALCWEMVLFVYCDAQVTEFMKSFPPRGLTSGKVTRIQACPRWDLEAE